MDSVADIVTAVIKSLIQIPLGINEVICLVINSGVQRLFSMLNAAFGEIEFKSYAYAVSPTTGRSFAKRLII